MCSSMGEVGLCRWVGGVQISSGSNPDPLRTWHLKKTIFTWGYALAYSAWSWFRSNHHQWSPSPSPSPLTLNLDVLIFDLDFLIFDLDFPIFDLDFLIFNLDLLANPYLKWNDYINVKPSPLIKPSMINVYYYTCWDLTITLSTIYLFRVLCLHFNLFLVHFSLDFCTII